MNARDWDEDRIRSALARAAEHLDVPEGHDLSTRVAAAITERRTQPRRAARLVLATATVVLVALVVPLFLSATYRSAVADLLGVLGIRIEVSDELPDRAPADLDLGDETSLELAEARAGFDVAVPRALGAPDRVFVDELASGTRAVSLLYAPRDGLPETSSTGIGALVMQFRADLHPDVIKKVAPDEAELRFVSVGGADGYWISGAPHGFFYVAPDGDLHEETYRLADNVLLWETGGITYRIESGLSLESSLEIAESLGT